MESTSLFERNPAFRELFVRWLWGSRIYRLKIVIISWVQILIAVYVSSYNKFVNIIALVHSVCVFETELTSSEFKAFWFCVIQWKTKRINFVLTWSDKLKGKCLSKSKVRQNSINQYLFIKGPIHSANDQKSHCCPTYDLYHWYKCRIKIHCICFVVHLASGSAVVSFIWEEESTR